MPSIVQPSPRDTYHSDSVVAQLTRQSEQLTEQSQKLHHLEQSFSELQGWIRQVCLEEFSRLQNKVASDGIGNSNILGGETEQIQQVDPQGEDGIESRIDDQSTLPSILGAMHQAGVETSPRTAAGDEQQPPWPSGSSPQPAYLPSAKFSKSNFLTRESAHGSSRLTYKWHESIWDASLFIGSAHLSKGASFVVAVCLLFNLSLVLAFISASANSLSTSDFNEESQKDFEHWRTTVAHDVALRNALSDESLASGVCNEKLFLPYSNLQILMVGALNDYLRTPSMNEEITTGSLMCCLALCVWFLTLTVEMADQYFVRLVSLSFYRTIWMVVLFVLRIAVVLVLGWSGTLFLIYETSLEEMILNAVSLELILNLDELLFHALLPRIPQAMITRILPIRHRRTRRGWNTYGEILILTVILLATAALVYLKKLQPFVELLRSNLDALCGGVEGSLDFVVAVDAIGIPWAAATSSLSEVAKTYAQHAVAEVKKLGFPPRDPDAGAAGKAPLQPTQRKNIGLFMQVASAATLDRIRLTSEEFKYPKDWEIINPDRMAEVLGWQGEIQVLGPGNQDFADEIGTVYNHYLQYLLGASQLENVSCKQVSFDLCSTHGSTMKDMVMRQLCPSRCGCASPTHGTVSNPWSRSSTFGFMGCAAWNIRRQVFVDTLSELPCTDLVSRDAFASWTEGVGDARSGGSGALLATRLLAAFESGGCFEVAQVDLGAGLAAKLCEESSLPAICPESCGCNTSVKYNYAHTQRIHYCPYSCGLSTPFCMTVVGGHNATQGAFGPLVGYACIFPFLYKARSYNSCTSEDWSGPWCAVTLKDGVVLNWGDCPDSC